MPRHETSRFQLSFGWLRGEDWWGDPVSQNFVLTDMLMHPFVKSMTQTSPPPGVVIGDQFIVPVGAEGDWLGHDNALVMLSENGWIYFMPGRPGVRVRVDSPGMWIWWDGTTWLDEGKDSVDPQPLLGTRYDVTVFVGYEAEAGETVLGFTIPEPMTMPANAVGSVGRSLAAPVGIHRLLLKRNGADIGTVTFIPGSVRAIFDVPADRVFAAGDMLTATLTDEPALGFAVYSATLRLILPTVTP